MDPTTLVAKVSDCGGVFGDVIPCDPASGSVLGVEENRVWGSGDGSEMGSMPLLMGSVWSSADFPLHCSQLGQLLRASPALLYMSVGTAVSLFIYRGCKLS